MVMNLYRTHEYWVSEQAKIDTIRRQHPEYYQHSGTFTHHDILQHIGITVILETLPPGYLRFRPEDFIVEEIDQQGQLASIELESPTLKDNVDQRTLFATMVKIGIGTPTALDRLAEAFGVQRTAIGFGGLKDAGALTAQRISLRGVSAERALQPVEALFLKDLAYGSGAISNGQLGGNRFTLTIRTPEPVDEALFDQQFRALGNGVLNFFGTQRFGKRWLAHHFGRLICQGKYDEAVREFLTATNSSEREYMVTIRHAVDQHYGDWPTVKRYFMEFPYTFHNELAVVDFLLEAPDDWVGALTAISEQSKMWVYAYTSYLLNATMSAMIASGNPVPATLPIPSTPVDAELAPFKPLLEADGIHGNFIHHLRRLPFIRPGSRTFNTIIKPKIHGWKPIPQGVVVSFDLPPGAYATTVLINLFTLFSGQPSPSWVKPDELDPKALLGTGSVLPIKQRYGQFFVVKDVGEETPES